MAKPDERPVSREESSARPAAARGRNFRPLAIGAALGVAGVAIVGVLFLGPVLLAHRQDLPLERQYGNYSIEIASRLGSGGQTSASAQSFRAARVGRDAYVGSCAGCHGASGDGKGVFGQAIYPPATDLTSRDAKEKSDAQLFWITKNGLSFTGMPGFAGQYDDQAIWALVAYIRALQNGQAVAEAVPTPSSAQISMADPHGSAAQRGAAVYFAEGCHGCHGAVGNAPGELALRGGGGEATRAVREGRRGMPAYVRI